MLTHIRHRRLTVFDSSKRVAVAVTALALGVAVADRGGVFPYAAAVTNPLSVVTVSVDVPTGMTATVEVIDRTGAVAAHAALSGPTTRIESLPAGTYHLIMQAETGVSRYGDVAVSAARAARSDPFFIHAGQVLVVRAVTS